MKEALFINKLFICTLKTDKNTCEYKDIQGRCLNKNKGCCFREEEHDLQEKTYIREKRWYEEIIESRNKKGGYNKYNV